MKKTVKPKKKKSVEKLPAKEKKKTLKTPKKQEKKPAGTEKYFESVGRRKTAVARVRLFVQPGSDFFVNNKKLKEYFPIEELRQTALSPLSLMSCSDQFRVEIRVKGGGLVSQAESIRHGLARALVLFNPDFRKKLKRAGYLKRDQRMRERKKFGLKRARRAPQWRKR